MASSSKGGGGGGGRGRPYGMMLLLAFGAAVLGVMVLHKLRERRLFSLLIQDKDQDLMNLHLLLKKEKESSKEYKRKIEDLKAKAYSLRAQKMELGNKIATLQSITTSLKDEQRVLESTIEEKQNIIKTLQQKRPGLSEGNSQIEALKELLKQKEAEIVEMKRIATKPTKIWSVSTDDPSKPLVNGTFAVPDKAVNSDHEEVDGDDVVKNVGEKRQNASEATVVKDNQAGQTEELQKDRNREGSSDNGDKELEESQGKGKFQIKSVNNNLDGFLAGSEKDNSNKTQAISTHLGNEMVRDSEDNEDGDVMKHGMEQSLANI